MRLVNRFGYSTDGVVATVQLTHARRHRKFIESHVRSLLDNGPTFILKAYRSKTRTISLHLLKLYEAQLDAESRPGPYTPGLVRYYVRELDRLNAELRILEDAMSTARIPYL